MDKVTVLKTKENGKVKSMLVFNSAGERAKILFSDDEKLKRIVVENAAKELVAFDLVDGQLVLDPLTPCCNGNNMDGTWRCDGGVSGQFWLYIKDHSGEWGKTSTGVSPRCFVNSYKATAETKDGQKTTVTDIRFQNAENFPAFSIKFDPEWKIHSTDERVSRFHSPCEVIEQDVKSSISTATIARQIDGGR